MRIVHHSTDGHARYIEIPSTVDDQYYRYDEVPNCDLLVMYFVNDYAFHNMFKRDMPRYCQLIHQMLHHSVFDRRVMQYITRPVKLPSVIVPHLDGKTLVDCLNRGITFSRINGSNGLDETLGYTNMTTIDTIDGAKQIKDKNLARFTSLTELDLSTSVASLEFLRDASHPLNRSLQTLQLVGSYVKDSSLCNLQNLTKLICGKTNMGISMDPRHNTFQTLTYLDVFGCKHFGDSSLQHFCNLKTLDARYTNVKFSFLTEDHPHPLALSLETLFIGAESMIIVPLRHFLKMKRLIVESYHTYDPNFKLDFLVPPHPLCETLEDLQIYNPWVDDRAIKHLKNLTYLDSSNYITFDFLTNDHSLCSSLQYLNTNIIMKDESLQHLHALTELEIWYENIHLSFLTPTHPMANTLTTLKLGSDSVVRWKELQHLQCLKIFHMTLDLDDAPPTHHIPLFDTVEDLKLCNGKSLHKFTNVHTLFIYSGPINMDFMFHSHPLTRSLRKITCRGTKMQNTGNLIDWMYSWKWLNKLQNLESFDESDTHIRFNTPLADVNSPIFETLVELRISTEFSYGEIENLFRFRSLRKLICRQDVSKMLMQRLPWAHPLHITLRNIEIYDPVDDY